MQEVSHDPLSGTACEPRAGSAGTLDLAMTREGIWQLAQDMPVEQHGRMDLAPIPRRCFCVAACSATTLGPSFPCLRSAEPAQQQSPLTASPHQETPTRSTCSARLIASTSLPWASLVSPHTLSDSWDHAHRGPLPLRSRIRPVVARPRVATREQ